MEKTSQDRSDLVFSSRAPRTLQFISILGDISTEPRVTRHRGSGANQPAFVRIFFRVRNYDCGGKEVPVVLFIDGDTPPLLTLGGRYKFVGNFEAVRQGAPSESAFRAYAVYGPKRLPKELGDPSSGQEGLLR
jgi:hypothetical protein